MSARPGGLVRIFAAVLVGLVLAPGAPPGLARAEPGTPGRPQAPDPVYSEDFANTSTTVPIPLSEYVGARPAGLTYTADPPWLDQGCNGSIVRADMAGLIVGAGCAGSSWGGVRQLAWALGKLRGADDADAFANYALSSFTQGDPGPGVVFATETDIELASDNRFLVFSLDAMASNCNQTRPELRFSIVNGGTATPLGDPLDPCAGPFSVQAPAIPGDNGIGPLLARGDRLRSTDAFLYTGSSFGLVLRNEQGSGAGNDSAIDNIAVVDATPQLDQSVSPERLVVGDVATLTYTVTNTNDLAAKTGWRLANTLPTGLAVAGTVGTTCVETEVAAEVGSRSVTVVNGRLRTGESSCAITVPVRADLAGSYVNGPADFTLAGLDAAAAVSVTFTTESASLSLTKSAKLTGSGDAIDYTFAVRNTGVSSVTGVTIVDALPLAGVECDTTSLAGGEDTECRGNYTLTDDDRLLGRVLNTATVTGRIPGGDPVVSPPSSATVDLDPTASLSIDKVAADPVDTNDNGYTDAGDTISYTFSVDNTGEIPVDAVVVEDSLLDDTTVCAALSLDPSEDTQCEGTYEITQQDVDEGEVVNTATVTGVADGEVISAQSSTSTEIKSPIELELDKTAEAPADRNGNGSADTGDTIDYAFRVTNTGAVTVGEVDVEDDLIPGIDCGDATLAPAEETTCSGSYRVDQSDVDAGSVDNQAAAVGVTPGGVAVTSSISSTSTALDDTAGLSFRNTSADPTDTDDDDQIGAGDQIGYAFAVGNTGSVTITDITVDDALLPDPAECGTTTLLPGESTTCTGTYRISQSDVDAGSVTNTANATGTDPGGGTVSSPEDSVETVITAGSGISLAKQSGPPDDLNANGVTDRGDTLFYSFTVRNTGEVSLSEIAVTDRRLAGVTCADVTLDPGQTSTCLADDDYVITQADMDSGSVANQATASGRQSDGDVVGSVAATETTPVSVVRAVGLVQQPVPVEDVNGSGRDDAGDRISFEFTVVNTGTVSLTGLTVRVPLLDDAGVSITCPGTVLAPGRTLTCMSDPYVITAADVAAGSVVIVATASVRTPAGSLSSAASSISVPLDESEPPTPNPTADPTPGITPPGSSGPPPGGSLPPQAPRTLSRWLPLLALLLIVPEAVLLIWRHRRNRALAAAAAARRQKPPEISIWMGR